jgi:hypothetical protein
VKVQFIAFLLLVASVSASAFEVSEITLNQYVEQKLAEKPNRNLKLLNPKVSLLDGYATFCAKARTKVVPSDVEFCANMTPKWRQATGSLLATKMAVVSLTAPGVGQQDVELLKLLMNQLVLPGLEGVEVYKAEDFIG